MVSASPQIAAPPPDEQAGRHISRLVIQHGPVEPRAVPAAAAFQMIGIGETTGWRLIREGRLEAVKIGRSTVVTIEAIDNFLATAPRRVPAANSMDKR